MKPVGAGRWVDATRAEPAMVSNIKLQPMKCFPQPRSARRHDFSKHISMHYLLWYTAPPPHAPRARQPAPPPIPAAKHPKVWRDSLQPAWYCFVGFPSRATLQDLGEWVLSMELRPMAHIPWTPTSAAPPFTTGGSGVAICMYDPKSQASRWAVVTQCAGSGAPPTCGATWRARPSSQPSAGHSKGQGIPSITRHEHKL